MVTEVTNTIAAGDVDKDVPVKVTDNTADGQIVIGVSQCNKVHKPMLLGLNVALGGKL